MKDIVTRLMQLADTYADNPFREGSESAKKHGEVSRKALHDELTRLLTPLSDEQIADFLRDEYHHMTESELKYFRLLEKHTALEANHEIT